MAGSATVALARKPAHNRVRWAAWITIAITIAAIVMGAVVRATHSGDGCGPNWPMCEGTLVFPGTGERAQLIEFSHRAISGFALIAVGILAVMVFRAFASGHPARRAVIWSVGFLVFEALIGAMIVIYGWVADDRSAARQVSVPLHLVNTFLLTASLAYTAWVIEGGRVPRLSAAPRRTRTLLGLSLVLLLIAATGATTSLADTLFSAEGVSEAGGQDFHTEEALIVQLRILHPIVAIAGGVVMMWFAWRHMEELERLGHVWPPRLVLFGVVVQASLGFIHIALATPIATGLVHLLLAQVIWMALVFMGLALLADPATEGEESPRLAGQAAG